MSASDESTPWAVAVRLAAAAGVPIDLLGELHDLHGRQWRLEDASRNRRASAHSIAVAKAEIDASNAQRHLLIDAVDAAARVPAPARATRYYSETIGELCDRLLILDHKLAALERLRDHANETSVEPWSAAAGRVRGVCAHLSVVVTQLIEDMAAGRAALPPRADVKIYSDPTDTGMKANPTPSTTDVRPRTFGDHADVRR